MDGTIWQRICGLWIPYVLASGLVLSYVLGTDPQRSWFGSGWVPFIASYLVATGVVVGVTVLPAFVRRRSAATKSSSGKGPSLLSR